MEGYTNEDEIYRHCKAGSNYRQAYLIEAHKEDFVFQTLIKMLDKKENDIFIHMDKKNKKYKENEIRALVKNAGLYHTDRINVNWGGYSQIKAELMLLQLATVTGEYDFYHLISGADLPIKSHEDIMKFFKKNKGKEFVKFEKEHFDFEKRVRYYYPLQELFGGKKNNTVKIINKIIILIQKLLQIKRNKNIIFQKGANWFSITDSLARYVIKNMSWIERTFKNTVCCDEIFLQTLVINSEFKDNLYHKKFDDDLNSIQRLIDWNRGDPYIFCSADIEEIAASHMIFCRKFDPEVDQQVIETACKMYS